MKIKRIAFLVFPQMTFLDLVGAYDALRRIAMMGIDPEVTHRIIGTDADVVDEGRVVTAGGVSSSLDLGLYLVERHWGAPAREQIAAQMEYRGYPAVVGR